MKIINIPIGEKIKTVFGEFIITEETSELLVFFSSDNKFASLNWSYDLHTNQLPTHIGGGAYTVKKETVDKLIEKYGYIETNYEEDNESKQFIKFKMKNGFTVTPTKMKYKKYVVCNTIRKGYIPVYTVSEVLDMDHEEVTYQNKIAIKIDGDFTYSNKASLTGIKIDLLDEYLIYQSDSLDDCIEHSKILHNKSKFNI